MNTYSDKFNTYQVYNPKKVTIPTVVKLIPLESIPDFYTNPYLGNSKSSTKNINKTISNTSNTNSSQISKNENLNINILNVTTKTNLTNSKLSSTIVELMLNLVKLGMDPITAAGFAGNAQKESGGVIDIKGDNGTSQGLMQFHKERLTNFKNFTNNDFSPKKTAEFIMHELLGSEHRAYEKITLAANTPKDKAIAISKYYERGASDKSNLQRGNYAELYYKHFKSNK